MPTRRGKIFNYYLANALRLDAETQPINEQEIERRIGITEERHSFRGEGVALTAVVRCDLNGYSKWCQKYKDIPKRIALLDSFFTQSIITADHYGGVYFRDEGDCLVVLFSDYFGGTNSLSRVNNFCRDISSKLYGADSLSAKTVVSVGEVVYFQKRHQVGNPDEWSADGDAFIFAARIEAEADSKQVVHFRKTEYDMHFKDTANADTNWVTKEDPVRIAGLWEPGGHEVLVKDIYQPSGEDEDTTDPDKTMNSLLTSTESPDPYEKRGGGRYA